MRGMTDQVERDVGHRDVFLENRAVAAPLAQPMAEDEAVVTQSQQVLEKGSHESFFIARGTL